MKNLLILVVMTMLLSTMAYAQPTKYNTQEQTHNMIQSQVMGLENAMLKLRINESSQNMEQVMNQIQTTQRERLQKLENLTFEFEEGIAYTYGKTEAKFLGLIPFQKQVKYEIDSSGLLTRQKNMFGFLWTIQDPDFKN